MDFQTLTEKLKKLNSFRPLNPSELKQLNANIKTEHIWSSNAIEGNTLSLNETRLVLENGLTVSGKPLKNYLEVLDLSTAYDYVENLASQKQSIAVRDIRDINRLVTLKTSDELARAGAFRTVDAYPNGYPDEKYSSPFVISEKIMDFVDWYNAENQLHPVEKAALTHLKLVSIHPFSDGNGRTSRLFMNFALMTEQYPIINIQPDKSSRSAYIDALRRARNDEFIQLVAAYVDKTLDFMIKTLELAQKNQADFEAYKTTSQLEI